MKKPMIKIHNVETDEVVEREMTNEEFSQFEIDKDSYELVKATKQVEADAKAQAKAAAEGKLAALGLTTDDLRALGL
jgi:hypothetical protein